MRIGGLDRRRLRWGLAAFVALLALPTAVLVREALGQLQYEAFHRQQQLARDLGEAVDGRLIRWINTEQARPAGDYEFATRAGEAAAAVVQRSPLSAWPPPAPVPGLVGYFQVDDEGRLTTPALPAGQLDPGRFGLSREELDARQALLARLESVLARGPVPGTPEPAATAQRSRPAAARESALRRDGRSNAEDEEHDALAEAERAPASAEAAAAEPLQKSLDPAAFDRLQESRPAAEAEAGALGRVEDLKLESTYADEDFAARPRQSAANQALLDQRAGPRKEKPATRVGEDVVQPGERRITAFETEVEPLAFARLPSGHFVLYRNVWERDRRRVQGLLLEATAFLEGLVGQAFVSSPAGRTSDLVVAYSGEVLAAWSGGGRDYLTRASELSGELLQRMKLSAPLSPLELIFSVSRLPLGPGASLIGWLAGLIALLLLGGAAALYRLGASQIEVLRQQQDFVAAVSHELKTPLTSIRMYGEMLREGWAPEDKRAEYYAFIHDEAERLSRLIGNVLQLARMTRNELPLSPRPVRVQELADHLRSKLASCVARAGFELELEVSAEDHQRVAVDLDALAQVAINLVDNALKFAAGAERKRIELALRAADGALELSVRDYGPGVPRGQLKKIFRLFYRPAGELTRETVGTGIGLALVHELVTRHGGRVEAVNRDPGAEFRVRLPLVEGAEPDAA